MRGLIKLYQFWLGIGLFLLALLFGLGLPMIIPATPFNGILIIIAGIIISIPFLIWAYILYIRQGRKIISDEAITKLNSKFLINTLTRMHQRMMELQKVKLSKKFNLKQFENALPVLMDKLGLVELDKWDNFEKSIRKRINRAIGKKRTGGRNAYFKAICEASRIKKELVQSQNWTLEDALKIGEWLDGYRWGIGELRDNDPQWKALWESINSYLVNNKFRKLIQKHVDFSYAYTNASLIAGYSRKYRASIRLSILYEVLVGSPISPEKIDLELSKILGDIEKQMSAVGQGEKELQKENQVERPSLEMKVQSCNILDYYPQPSGLIANVFGHHNIIEAVTEFHPKGDIKLHSIELHMGHHTFRTKNLPIIIVDCDAVYSIPFEVPSKIIEYQMTSTENYLRALFNDRDGRSNKFSLYRFTKAKTGDI